MEPDLIERQTGGWLAVAPAQSALRIAVTAPTRAEAVEAFSNEWVEWQGLLATAARRNAHPQGRNCGDAAAPAPSA
jgi:hypothetical protein